MRRGACRIASSHECPQLSQSAEGEKFGLAKVKVVSQRSLFLALMSSSTPATFGLVLCPSAIFWTPRFSRGSISPTWSHRHSLSTRLMPSSFTTVLCRLVSRKLFANRMKSVGMHLSGGRSLHGFSSLNCYHTSLHPRCAGSKPRATRTLRAKYKAKDDSTGRVRRVF